MNYGKRWSRRVVEWVLWRAQSRQLVHSALIACIEPPEVIAKILTHLPACADGRQGVVAHSSPQLVGTIHCRVAS